MSTPRSRRRTAGRVLAATVAAAGLTMAIPAQADPLWPGGPNVPGLPALIPTVAPCGTSARACLRLATNEAWLMEEGRVVYGPSPISHGMPGYETPPGVFRVAFKRLYHWSTMHHAPMHFAVFFNGDIATHIGPVEHKSHGCIRMTPEGAEATYNHLSPGDVVEVVP
ncbi:MULTISPECIES: L,D-transpeptidase [Nocardia]|uniref:L,D-transpeptidase n=1 Tax=Nocardia aurea TaxID=2144174 RepID=A0ABV3G1S1_9NOCA|nr:MULTISPECIES: L,D-transpeptidase [Nocardia]